MPNPIPYVMAAIQTGGALLLLIGVAILFVIVNVGTLVAGFVFEAAMICLALIVTAVDTASAAIRRAKQ